MLARAAASFSCRQGSLAVLEACTAPGILPLGQKPQVGPANYYTVGILSGHTSTLATTSATTVFSVRGPALKPRQPLVFDTSSRTSLAQALHPAVHRHGYCSVKETASLPFYYNIPNLVSLARLASGPVIAYWLLTDQVANATIALIIAGASDWLDGYLARKLNQGSVAGSYLDPLADKVLIACVAGALLAKGTMPLWLGGVILGRDVVLVLGSFAYRFHMLGWRWPGIDAYFKGKGSALAEGGEGMPYMRPLLISKFNTVLQLALVGSYLTSALVAWPPSDVVHGLEYATAATTIVSVLAYGVKLQQGSLFK